MTIDKLLRLTNQSITF